LRDGVVSSVTATFYSDLPQDTSYFLEAGGMQVYDGLNITHVIYNSSLQD